MHLWRKKHAFPALMFWASGLAKEQDLDELFKSFIHLRGRSARFWLNILTPTCNIKTETFERFSCC